MYYCFKNKKVGIWGFGTVGKSALSFLSPLECQISVIDAKEPDALQEALLKGHNARFVPETLLPQFLEMNDYIIASPGVNLTPWADFKHKFISEIDLFASLVKKPTIAVTGSIGKTTLVHVLTHLLTEYGQKALAAGNIGYPLLDALSVQHEYDVLVLELSSFQLEHNTHFAPDLALVTNIFPNHLDRHVTMEEYITAKGKLLALQTEEQAAIVPLDFIDEFWPFVNSQKMVWLGNQNDLNIDKELYDITCAQNWNMILAALESWKIDPVDLTQKMKSMPRLPHRIEPAGIHNGIRFYNDSKSTIAQATLNAVNQFKGNDIILFLGGIGKGVDRSDLIKELAETVKEIICFGKEAETLHTQCVAEDIKSSCHPTLETAFEHCIKNAVSGDVVLFSPSGASYDLFEHYEARGNQFKKLVANFKK